MHNGINWFFRIYENIGMNAPFELDVCLLIEIYYAYNLKTTKLKIL